MPERIPSERVGYDAILIVIVTGPVLRQGQLLFQRETPMIDIGLILARFAHYAATTVLFGVSLFPLYAYRNSEPAPSRSWRSRLLLATAVTAAISGLIWFLFSAANMAGSLSNLADAENLWAAIRDTGFGNVWTARMLLAVLIVVATAAYALRKASIGENLLVLILAAVLLASLAGAGHAQVEEGGASVVHVFSDAAHLLAAGAWLGGLVPLAYVLACHARPSRDAGQLDQVLLRFSGMGYVAVATLVGTGLVNSWFLVGSLSNLLGTPYGQVLLVKLVLFAGMALSPLQTGFGSFRRSAVFSAITRNNLWLTCADCVTMCSASRFWGRRFF